MKNSTGLEMKGHPVLRPAQSVAVRHLCRSQVTENTILREGISFHRTMDASEGKESI
jgi:hypothetical protein